MTTSSVFKLLALLALTLLPGACATGGSAVASAPIKQPQDLLGTTWKLAMTGDGRDGRHIEFRKGERNLHAVLTVVGSRLQKVVGAYPGHVLMELVPDGSPTTFIGIERVPGRDLAEVRCSISAKGDEMKCSNEEWVWTRES